MTNALKQVREKHGITLRELADRSGYGVSTINNYENGKTDVSDEFLEKIANVLGEPVTSICGDRSLREEGRTYRTERSQTIDIPEWASALIARLAQLTPERRHKMITAFHLSLDLHLTHPSQPPMVPIPDAGPVVRETMPGIDPVVADVVRGGALAAQRLARESATGDRAGSTSARTRQKSGAPGGESSQQSGTPTPAPKTRGGPGAHS